MVNGEQLIRGCIIGLPFTVYKALAALRFAANKVSSTDKGQQTCHVLLKTWPLILSIPYLLVGIGNFASGLDPSSPSGIGIPNR